MTMTTGIEMIPRRTRARRTVGTPQNAKARLTERDLWIVDAIARMLFVTTRQMADLFFNGSRWAANKGLRRLVDTGLLRVSVRGLNSDNIYAITPKGRAELLNEIDDLETAIRCPRALPEQLDHFLAIGSVRVAMARGLPACGAKLAWWLSDWQLRATRRGSTIPDALFGVTTANDAESVFALELDNASRNARKFVTKILGYGRSAYGGLYGHTRFTVLVVGRDPRMVERYRTAIAVLPMQSVSTWFTTLLMIENEGVDGPIWQSFSGDETVSLRGVLSFPNRKEAMPHENQGFPGVCADAAATDNPL